MVRKAKVSDAERISEIHVFSWRISYRHMLSDEILFNTLKVQTSLNKHRQNLTSGDETLWVYDDGIIKGFMAAVEEGKFLEIKAIYIDPAFYREGCGAALMKFAEEYAASQGVTQIFLWVLEGNTPARSFYEKHGYSSDGVRTYREVLDAHELRYSKKL